MLILEVDVVVLRAGEAPLAAISGSERPVFNSDPPDSCFVVTDAAVSVLHRPLLLLLLLQLLLLLLLLLEVPAAVDVAGLAVLLELAELHTSNSISDMRSFSNWLM